MTNSRRLIAIKNLEAPHNSYRLLGKLRPFQFIFEPLQYCCIGGFNTVVTAAIMALLAHFGVGYIAYTFVGYLVGFVISYAANSLITFQIGSLSIHAFARFLIVNVGLLACIQILQYGLIEVFGFRELYVVMTCMGIYTIVGFLLNRRFVFVRRERPL